MSRALKIVNVVGARPNYMKVAPIYRAMQEYPEIQPCIVHTGQHYDHAMSDLFFNQLELPEPHYHLGVGSASHGEQTGKIMIAFEPILAELKPDVVVVVGDVNSTIACGLVATKMGIRLAHVEAGLRSFDRTMPEEINRVMTDQISDYLFTTEASAHENLKMEGIKKGKIFFVGNVMIDSLLRHRKKAAGGDALRNLGLEPNNYVLVTLHRPSNVDDRDMLVQLISALCDLSEKVPIVFPLHPRTRSRVQAFGLEDMFNRSHGFVLTEPLGYLDFVQCMDNALVVVTDSGGVQEESTVLGVPCITVRDNTERPVTVSEGTNVVVGRNPTRLLEEAFRVLRGEGKKGRVPALWDGSAAERIVRILVEEDRAESSLGGGRDYVPR